MGMLVYMRPRLFLGTISLHLDVLMWKKHLILRLEVRPPHLKSVLYWYIC